MTWCFTRACPPCIRDLVIGLAHSATHCQASIQLRQSSQRSFRVSIADIALAALVDHIVALLDDASGALGLAIARKPTPSDIMMVNAHPSGISVQHWCFSVALYHDTRVRARWCLYVFECKPRTNQVLPYSGTSRAARGNALTSPCSSGR